MLALPEPVRAVTLRDSTLRVDLLVSGLSSPTTMAFIGPNDLLVLQKNDGRVRRVTNGVLQPNASLTFVCRDVRVGVERSDLAFTARAEAGSELTLPVKHGEGCWFADDALLADLEARSQIALRYAAGENPNGAVADVAGVCNEAGNVLGLMPHPEHAVDVLTGSVDGLALIGSPA